MDYGELQRAFEGYSNIIGEVDDADLALWFNEAQLDLTLDFGATKSVTITPVNGVVDRPEDCLKLLGASRNFSLNERGQLLFDSDVDVSVEYIGMPNTKFTGTDPEQIPDLPSPFHYLLAVYATSEYWARESEGDTEEMNLANWWLAKYQSAKQKFKTIYGITGSGAVDHWVVI